LALQRISRATGLHIVMGAGYYLEPAHPRHVRTMSLSAIAEEIECDVVLGDQGVRAGIIGEIGISKDFTPEEEKVLRAAARAQKATGVPLEVHLPGWERHGGRVLDVVAEEGGDLRRTILCHMNPSGEDFAYQAALAERGAWLEYDMIGMDFFYADQQAQSPSDEDNARAISRLRDAGLLGSVLISQDVFVKIQLVRYGGTGYAHILDHFVPRLIRHGFTADDVQTLLVDNPRRVFGDETEDGRRETGD
jgi:phosphotriesterase-related protein